MRTHTLATLAALALTLPAAACSSPGNASPGATPTPNPSAASAGPSDAPVLARPADDGDRARVAAIDKVGYLVGEWEGQGTVTTGQSKVSFTQREKIERQLMGDLLTVRGTALPPQGGDTAAFNAFALLTYDVQGKQYVWRAYSSQSHGHSLETPLVVTDDGWHWDMKPDPGAPMIMRNETKFSENHTVWTETTSMSPDGGKTWIPTMTMTLKKKG